MVHHDPTMTRAAMKHLARYVETNDEFNLELAGHVVAMAPNQRVTLNRIASLLVNKPDAYLNGMVHALQLTPNIIQFDMRARVRALRTMRA